ELLNGFRYWFVDQDILNSVFYKRVKYLSMEWNVYHGNGNMMGLFPKLDPNTYQEYLASRSHPKIIHFAGDQKPWTNKNVDFFDEFYKYIHNTEWQSDLEESLNSISALKRFKSMTAPFLN